MSKTNNLTSTPKMGILKGIVLIIVGFLWLNTYALGAMLGYVDSGQISGYYAGVIFGWLIFLLCEWRGVISIVKRNEKYISGTEMFLLTLFFSATLLIVIITLI